MAGESQNKSYPLMSSVSQQRLLFRSLELACGFVCYTCYMEKAEEGGGEVEWLLLLDFYVC